MRLSHRQLPRPSLSLSLSFGLLLAAGLSARAQMLPAGDFFNTGAQLYISNNIPAAKQMVANGRKLYPDDKQLKELEDLLNQQQKQQQQQQQQNQSQQNKENQSQQNQQKNQQQQSQSQQQQSQKEKEEQAKKEAEEKKAQEQKAKEDKSAGETNETAQAQGAHAMSPEDAKRLLDSQKGSEQYLSLKPKDKPRDDRHPIKDW